MLGPRFAQSRPVGKQTAESLRRELAGLEGQDLEERHAEAEAFRLRTHGRVGEDVYEQEVGLIHACRRVEAKLAGATDEDRRLVLEAVGAFVIVQQNAAWELELEALRHGEPEVQTVVKGLGSVRCWILQKRCPQGTGGRGRGWRASGRRSRGWRAGSGRSLQE